MTPLFILAVACLALWCLYLQAQCGILTAALASFRNAQQDAARSLNERVKRLERAEVGRQGEMLLGHIHQQRGLDRRQGYDPMAGRNVKGLPIPHGKHAGGVGAVEEWDTTLTPTEAAQAQELLAAAGHAGPSKRLEEWELEGRAALLAEEAAE